MGDQKRGRRGEICERGGGRWGIRREGDGERYVREEGEMGEQKGGRRGEICERGGRDGGTEERESGIDM